MKPYNSKRRLSRWPKRVLIRILGYMIWIPPITVEKIYLLKNNLHSPCKK
jgi:hypothetical protein